MFVYISVLLLFCFVLYSDLFIVFAFYLVIMSSLSTASYISGLDISLLYFLFVLFSSISIFCSLSLTFVASSSLLYFLCFYSLSSLPCLFMLSPCNHASFTLCYVFLFHSLSLVLQLLTGHSTLCFITTSYSESIIPIKSHSLLCFSLHSCIHHRHLHKGRSGLILTHHLSDKLVFPR